MSWSNQNRGFRTGFNNSRPIRATETAGWQAPQKRTQPIQPKPVQENVGLAEISGEVVYEIFHAADSGFTVLSIDIKGNKGLKGNRSVKIQGNSANRFNPGDTIVAKGNWIKFKGVDQFKAEIIRLNLPRGTEAILKWLSRGAVKGVGPATIAKLKDHFGENLPDVIGDETLLEEAKISRSAAQSIARVYASNTKSVEVELALTQAGLGPKQIAKVFEHFGASAKRVVETNPWELLEIERIGFLTADKIAIKNCIDMNCPARIQAGIRWVLTEVLSAWGHCGIPKDELVAMSSRKLDVSPDLVQKELPEVIDNISIIDDPLTELVYARQLYEAEQEIAAHLVALLHNSEGALNHAAATDAILKAEKELGVELDRDGQQFEAAVSALTNAVMIITGGPGTGKSTTQKVIAHARESFGRTVSLAAPTGRAAKRLTEASGREARTIHRLLEFSPQAGGFLNNANHQLKIDDLIIDESSMVDVKLAASVFSALGPDACVTLVGDFDQLPSVGAGQVLRDLIESNVIPVVRLTKVRRTAEGSGIALAAQRINRGESPVDEKEIVRGFEMYDVSDEKIVEALVRLVRFRLPEMGYDPMRDVQVLAAQRIGSLGIPIFNAALKQALNPALEDNNTVQIIKTFWTVGDRVMQMKNDYTKGIYNGEVGTIVEVGQGPDETGARSSWIRVDFSGVDARYKGEEANDIEHAFAATVHKSQGCEFPVTVLVTPQAHARMLNRNLIYTGVTRARSECFILGSKQLIREGVNKRDSFHRWTGLQARLDMFAKAHTPARPMGWQD